MGNTLALDKLTGHIDEIWDMLISGATFTKISSDFGVSIGALHNFVYQDEYSARTREIISESAEVYTDKAEDVLINAPSDLVEMMRAKELSQFYRWKASKRNPRAFGNNTDNTLNVNINQPMTPEQFNRFIEAQEKKALAIGQRTIDTGYEDVTNLDDEETTEHTDTIK